MAGFLGGVAGIAVDPLLIIVCIFIAIKVSSIGNAVLYAGIFSVIVMALLAPSINAGLLIQSFLAGVVDSAIIYSIYDKFIKQKDNKSDE